LGRPRRLRHYIILFPLFSVVLNTPKALLKFQTDKELHHKFDGNDVGQENLFRVTARSCC